MQMSNVAKILAAVLLVVSGHLLAGCDGPSDLGNSSGLKYSDSGMPYCDIPSPTGTNAAAGHTYVVVGDQMGNGTQILSDDVVATRCESEKSQKIVSINGQQVSTAGLDCSDAAHDFQGSTGTTWCVGGGWVLDPTTIEVMHKSVAYCSTSGVFLGWSCGG
jgi:hypothetical protein